MKTVYNLTRYILPLLLVALTISSCSKEPTAPDDVEVIPGVDVNIHVDEGNVGLVIDTRKITKKGYAPTTAIVSFPSYARFDTVLAINATTNLAILQIHNTRLTEEEKVAFASGITADIMIIDETQSQLTSQHEDNLVLDDSNTPLSLTTSLSYIQPPLKIKEGIPYLMQIEGTESEGILTQQSFSEFQINFYNITNPVNQQFYLTLVPGGNPDTYLISNFTDGKAYWVRSEGQINNQAFVELSYGVPEEWVIEQDEEGWARIKHKDTDEYIMAIYVYNNYKYLTFGGSGLRFRFISDHINWQIEDRGTVFHQPIMAPTKLDFAYSGTLRNCSSATLEETIGTTESRTRTTTIGTSESLALFSQNQLEVGVKVGYSVTAKVGVDVKGIGEAGEEVTVSEEINFNQTFTTSETSTSENTWSESESKTVEVSRTRTITVPPFTAVEAYDAVKTVENVRIPFTQVLRIRATDTDTGTNLSGDEIVTQMLFNFASGVISAVDNDFIDISIRGYATMDQLFEATTNVQELENGCN